MTEPNGNLTALKVVCGIMSGMLVTILFMWLTFPRDLATNAAIIGLTSAMQKQIDDLHQSQQQEDSSINRLNVTVGQLQLKTGLADTPR